jgi:hypothetical protein
MKRILGPLIFLFGIAISASATDLSTASSRDLIGIYKQLRTIQGSDKAATTENIVFRRDSATFNFISGRIAFAAPIADRVLAARFQGEGIFELNPPHPIDKRQIARFARSPRLTDTFTEAVFFFTDDTFTEMEKLIKVVSVPSSDPVIFSSTQKKFAESFNSWYDNQAKGFPVMRNMAARMLADLTDNSSKGFFLADFKGKNSGDLLFHISWNRDSMLLPDYAKGEEVMLLHLRPGNYHEWWSGFHLSSEYVKSSRPDHRTLLAHCPSAQIDLQVPRNNEIVATAQLDYIVNEGTPRILPFSLSGVLRISSVEDGAGNPINFIQEDRRLDNDPWLILAEPAKPGEKYRVKIAYKEDSTRDSRLIHQRGSGLYYVTERTSWFPSFGSIDDRTQYEIRARSPKQFKFVATGQLISSEKGKDELVTAWKTESPVAVVGFNYGNFVESSQALADLKITAYSGKDIPDELKAILVESDVGDLAAMAGYGGQKNMGPSRGGFNTSKSVKDAAALSLHAFRFFEFLFGPLPFKNISVTQQPVRGYAQSWPYLIFLPYDVFLDSTTRNALGLSDSREQREFYQIVAIHEMAHQWCGHLVGWKTYHDQWLSEGIADFASGLYLRYFAPQEVNTFWNIRRTTLLQKNTLGYRPAAVGPVWLNPQLNEYNGWENSQAMIYYKGGYIIEMLRALMYDPKLQEPNARFIAMMQEFTRTFAGQNASTEDFRKIVDKHNGRSMEWFFNQWVYGTEIPTYDFKYEFRDSDGGQTEVLITLTQSDVTPNFYMQLPLYVSSQGKLMHVGLIGITGTKPLNTSFKLPMKPDKVLLDPERSIFAEIHQ